MMLQVWGFGTDSYCLSYGVVGYAQVVGRYLFGGL